MSRSVAGIVSDALLGFGTKSRLYLSDCTCLVQVVIATSEETLLHTLTRAVIITTDHTPRIVLRIVQGSSNESHARL